MRVFRYRRALLFQSLWHAGTAIGLGATLLTGAGCDNRKRPTPVTGDSPNMVFTDVTAASGIRFICRNGVEANMLSIAESLGGGAGAFDYDRDGRTDLYLVGGGTIEPNVALVGKSSGLFRNQNGSQFEDVSIEALVDHVGHYSHGIAIGDYNNDGFEDYLVTGYGGVLLYRNQGDGTFTEVTEDADLADRQWSSAACWGDINGDGFVDLYVTHYLNWSWANNPSCFPAGEIQDVCGPERFEGLDDTLYLSNGDGTFTDASQESGLREGGKGLAVVMFDVEGDRDLDIYVANDTDDNFLYINDGSGQLIERGVPSGTAHDESGFANGSMGVSVLDYNQDAMADLWVANFENDSFALYRNEGNAAFTHASGSAGIFAIGSSYVGWGTITDDLDGDGDDDIVVSNGHVRYHPKSGTVRQLPLVLQFGEKRFQLRSYPPESYFGKPHHGRGLAKLDMDNDGDWDLGFANLNEPFTLLRNDIVRSRAWIGVRLVGVKSNRDAIGAAVTLKSPDGDRSRFVASGESYLSHNSRRLLWSIPPKTQFAEMEIQWPSGREQRIVVKTFNRYLDVVEPGGG